MLGPSLQCGNISLGGSLHRRRFRQRILAPKGEINQWQCDEQRYQYNIDDARSMRRLTIYLYYLLVDR